MGAFDAMNGLRNIGRALHAWVIPEQASIPEAWKVFTEDGKFLDQWRDIVNPSHFWMTQDGHVWLVSGVGNRLAEFDLRGRLVTYWGMYGRQPGWFDDPHTIDVDPSGNLYVAEVWNNRVEKFVPRPGAGASRLIGKKFILPSGHK